MALLKCPECGADVSSSSKVCMKCGYPVSEIINAVEPAGENINAVEPTDATTNAAKPEDAITSTIEPVSAANANIKTEKLVEKKGLPIKILVPILLAACAIVFFVILKPVFLRGKNPFFTEVKWHTSHADAQSKLEEAGERVITAEDSNYIIIGYDNYLDIEGLSAMLAYEFENDSLTSVLVTVMAGDACVMSEDEVAVILKKKLDTAYGNPGKGKRWQTNDSSISVVYIPGAYVIKYEPL